MNIFRRVEKKYILTDSEYKCFMERVREHLHEDIYFKSTICNIYFDNDNYDLIVNSLEHPQFKEKIRLRCYETPKSMNDKVFFEIKGKYNGVVFKRRIDIKLKDYYDYINKGILPRDNQIMQEIDYTIKKFKLKPKLFLAYDRYSYYDKDNQEFRITFDENIRSRIKDINLEYGDAGKLYFDEKVHIMEIKALDAIPLWFTKALSELKIYPNSFSKYGNIYMKDLKE